MPDVLKSFLVDLGFKTDEAGLRRFTQQLQQTHHVVRDFAVAVGAMAVGAEEAIRRTAKQFENLFYLSQQTGVAVNTIKGLESAFRQVGLSAGDADAAIAGLDTLFRDMPGMRAFARQWTGTDAPDQVILRLAKQYRDLLSIADVGRRQAAEAQFRSGILAPLGLDPTSLLRLGQNIEAALQGKRFQERLAKAFGIDPQQAAADATELERIFNEMWATIKMGADTLIVTTFPALRKLLEDFTRWLSTEGAAHVKRWGDNLNKFLNDPELLPAIERAFKAIGTAVGEIVTGIENWIGKEQGLDKTKNALIGIADAIGSIKSVVEWLIAHPKLAGMFAGGIAGSRFGPVGGLVGMLGGSLAGGELARNERSDVYDRALMEYYRSHSRGQDRRTPVEFQQQFLQEHPDPETKRVYDSIDKWISGAKQTPWVKIETTDKPLIIDFASQVYERLMVVLGINTTTPGMAAGAGGAGAMGYRPAGRFGGMAPSRTRPMGFNAGASGPGVTSLSEMVKLAKQAGFSEQDAPIIASIAMAESSGRLGAVGGVGELGLTQINPHAWGQKLAQFAASSPLASFQAAKQVLDKQGFSAWTTFTKGTYRDFLGAAMGQTAPTGQGQAGAAPAGQATGMDPGFKSTLNRAFAAAKEATGEALTIFSGFRDHAKQTKLFMASDRSGHMVARPGHSMHERGLAADIRGGAGAMHWLHEHAKEMGLNFPMGYEPWHIEPLGARSRSGNVNIDSDHKVEINVHGATDAHGTARAVRDAQDRHSALHSRNLKTAIA